MEQEKLISLFPAMVVRVQVSLTNERHKIASLQNCMISCCSGQEPFPVAFEPHYVETAQLDSHWTAGLTSENVPVTVSSLSWIYHTKIEIMF